MRVTPKPHPLRRHTSDRSTEFHRTKRFNQQTQRPAPSNQITSPPSSGYDPTNPRTSDYPHWRCSDTRTSDDNLDYRPHPQKHDSLTDLRHYATNIETSRGGLRKKPTSSSSLDHNSYYSEGSQSSYTGSLADPSNRMGLSRVSGIDHTYHGSPASSRSDFSDHYPNGGRYTNR